MGASPRAPAVLGLEQAQVLHRVRDLRAQQHEEPRRVDPHEHERHEPERAVHAAVALQHDLRREAHEQELEPLERERREDARR